MVRLKLCLYTSVSAEGFPGVCMWDITRISHTVAILKCLLKLIIHSRLVAGPIDKGSCLFKMTTFQSKIACPLFSIGPVKVRRDWGHSFFPNKRNKWMRAHSLMLFRILGSTGDKSNKISMQKSCSLEAYNFLCKWFPFWGWNKHDNAVLWAGFRCVRAV